MKGWMDRWMERIIDGRIDGLRDGPKDRGMGEGLYWIRLSHQPLPSLSLFLSLPGAMLGPPLSREHALPLPLSSTPYPTPCPWSQATASPICSP